jgi:hypothetical protein
MLLSLTTSAIAGELVREPGKASSWQLDVTDTAAAKVTEDQGALRFDITQVDSTNWHIQAYQVVTGIRSKTPYTIRFMAKASSPRPLAVGDQLNGPPWSQLTPWRAPEQLTTDWRHYAVPVEFDGAEGKEIRVPMFILGEATGTVWIKNISMREASATSEPAVAAASDGNLLGNAMEPSSWALQQFSGAKATLTKSNGELRLQIDKTGTENWHIQFYMMPAELKTPGHYTLKITMRADAPRKISFYASEDTAPYAQLLPPTVIAVDGQWKQYTIKFPLKSLAAGKTRLPQFLLGTSTGTFSFRSISLTGPEDSRK